MPIVGGTFEARVDDLAGHRTVHGSVLPGGVDDQVLVSPTRTDLDAVYAVRTQDGALLRVHNVGVRSGDATALARIARGEPADPDSVYFRTWPRLTSSHPAWAWTGETLFVGVGVREPHRVVIDVYRLG